jgi:hypothetical protein
LILELGKHAKFEFCILTWHLLSITDGPTSVIISPPDQTISLKDGDYIGPYHCSADCNPPCTIQWKYKLSNGTFLDAKSNGLTLLRQQSNGMFGNVMSSGATLLRQQVFRDKDKALFRCTALQNGIRKSQADINLNVMCKNLKCIVSKRNYRISRNFREDFILALLASVLRSLKLDIDDISFQICGRSFRMN